MFSSTSAHRAPLRCSGLVFCFIFGATARGMCGPWARRSARGRARRARAAGRRAPGAGARGGARGRVCAACGEGAKRSYLVVDTWKF